MTNEMVLKGTGYKMEAQIFINAQDMGFTSFGKLCRMGDEVAVGKNFVELNL